MRARRARRAARRSDRHRARHGDRRRRQDAVRGDDAAPRHRDVRAPRQGDVHHRLARGRHAARLHHERALLRRRRHGARSARRLRRPARPSACASSATRASASARTTCASCASSASARSMATPTRPTPTASPPRRPRRRAWRSYRASAFAPNCCCCSLPRRGAGAALDARGRHHRAAARRRRAMSSWSSGWRRSRRRLQRAPDPLLRLAALASGTRADLRREAAPVDARMPTDWRTPTAVTAPSTHARGEAAAKAFIYRQGAQAFVDGALVDWARSGDDADRSGAGRARRPCPSAGARRNCRCAAPTSSRSAFPPGPAVGRVMARFEEWWIGAGYPQTAGELRAKLEELARGELTARRDA